MPRNTNVYDIVLSCPTDVQDEIEVIENVLKDFNKTIGMGLGATLNLKHWTTDSYSQSGGTAQSLLNDQFINDADMIICIFWNRMGTPTEDYESGTAEEMLKAISDGKQVFLYFSNRSSAPDKMDTFQLEQVRSFEKKIQALGVQYYKRYEDLEDFKSKITLDLNLYFLQAQKLKKEESLQTQSNLMISGIKNKNVGNHISYESPFIKFENFISEKEKIIVELARSIQEIKISSTINISENSYPSKGRGYHKEDFANIFGRKPFTYSEILMHTINEYFKTKNLSLDDNFYHTGELSIQKNYIVIFGNEPTTVLVGTDEEKNKQALVTELYIKICEINEWVEYIEQFSDIKFVRLALSNKGKIFESDISVNLKILKSSFVQLKSMNLPKNNIIEEINDSSFVNEIFGDLNSVEVTPYGHSISVSDIPSVQIPEITGFSVRHSYEVQSSNYIRQLELLKQYEEYEEGKYIIQKYHFSQLKQHTHISFPVVLLFRSTNENLKIEYEIISKDNPEKKLGLITEL